MLGTWLLFLLIPLVTAQKQKSAFVVPTFEGSNVEFYDMGNIRYGIFLDKVAFEEARQTCLAADGALVEYTHPGTAKFIARALAESAVGFSTLWIGGVYIPAKNDTPGVWKWMSGTNITRRRIPDNYTFPMTQPPFWVGRPRLQSRVAACLVTDRNNHHMPLIVGLPCGVRRPFICAMPLGQSPPGPQPIPPVDTKDKTFYIYRAEFTWAEGLSFCRSLGYKLAIVTEHDEFTQIQNRMRRVRPIIENAWISGAFIDGQWIWVSTNKEIPTDIVANDPTAPPWYRPDNIIKEGCLLADRHLCDYLVYVEARCDRKRSVICQSDDANDDDDIKKVNGSNIFASTVRLSWEDARAMCEKCVSDGTLLQLATHDKQLLDAQIKWLFTAMTVLFGTEIRHVWLNGRLKNNEFRWSIDPTGKSNKEWTYKVNPNGDSNTTTSLLEDKGDHGFIIYCPGNFKADPYLKKYECLNLDRENLKHFFMYGLECKYKQHFICMGKNDHGATSIINHNCKHSIVNIFNQTDGGGDTKTPTCSEDDYYCDLDPPETHFR